jgi:hypothetical protein
MPSNALPFAIAMLARNNTAADRISKSRVPSAELSLVAHDAVLATRMKASEAIGARIGERIIMPDSSTAEVTDVVVAISSGVTSLVLTPMTPRDHILLVPPEAIEEDQGARRLASLDLAVAAPRDLVG